MPKRVKKATISIKKRLAPVKVKSSFDKLIITDHRQLLAAARQISTRLKGDSDFSVMLLANPVLALKEYGIELNKEMQNHVLTTLRHPPKLRKRRAELEQSLSKELGAAPKPTNQVWMADLVFDIRKQKPKSLTGLMPVYLEQLRAESIKRLQEKRPIGRVRYPTRNKVVTKFTLRIADPKPAIRRLDLAADIPPTKARKTRPAKLSLEDAWFYKDDQVVRDAVELGQIMRRGFPFKTPAQFRALADADKADGFRTFVRKVGVKVGT